MQKATQISLTLLIAGYASGVQTKVMDSRLMPAEERTFTSAGGKCVLRVSTLDHWKTPHPTAVFLMGGKVKWRKILPHWHGPKEVAITDFGDVVLLDEWPNSPSERAVTIFSKGGVIQKVWSFNDVQVAATSLPKDIARGARIGCWMGAVPVVKGRVVQVPVANTVLIIDAKRLVIHT